MGCTVSKRQVVMIDPRSVKSKDMYPGEIARVEFISEIQKDIAIVYFDERGVYNAYNVKDLLVIHSEQIIFENICHNYNKLSKDEIKELFAVLINYQKKYYENSFRIALKNEVIATLCMTDLGAFAKLLMKQ